MKILIVSQKYFPEPFAITSIAENLASRGHEVTVLCGIPNYPKGDYYRGYSIRKKREQYINNVSIVRAFEFPRKRNIFCRFLNYYSFAFFGQRTINRLDEDFDVVLINGLSPILMALPAIKYKKKNGAKLLMYEMDLWPESLLAGGIKRNGLLYNYYKKISAKIYGSMDEILVSSKSHSDYIKKLVQKELPIKWLPQYSTDNITSYWRDYTNDSNPICVFTGNIGKAQSLETLLKVAKILEDEKVNISFLIVGDGSEKKRLTSLKERDHINNVSFSNSVTGNQFNQLLKKASFGIVILKDDSYCQLTLPRKVQTYMKAGLPIVSCAGGATNEIVNVAKCGICVQPDNPKKLAHSIKTFINSPATKKAKMSQNSIDFYEKYLTKDDFMSVLEDSLQRLSRKRG